MIVPMYYLCVEGLKKGIRRNPNASCHPKEHLKSHIIRAEGVQDKERSWSSSGCAMRQESEKEVKGMKCPQSFNPEDCASFTSYINRGFRKY